MKFGLVDDTTLAQLDLHLPEDHADNAGILKSKGRKGDPAVYCGCAKYGIKAWDGLLYPAGTKESDYLSAYLKQFNAIELNASFYSMKKAPFVTWAEAAPEGFKFCPKFNRRFSHIKRLILEEGEDYLEYFINTTSILGDNLGMSFLQMPENFAPKYFDRLQYFIEQIPEDYPMAVELRHPDWFTDTAVFDRTFELFRKHQVTPVITDVAGEREILHMRLAGPAVFVRFNGYGMTDLTRSRLDEWVGRLKSWIDQGMETIYFFPHQQDEKYTPLSCAYFLNKMNEVCGLELKVPQLLGEAE